MKLLSREVEVTPDKPNGFGGSKVVRVVNLGDYPVVVEVFVQGEPEDKAVSGSVTIVPNVPEEIDKAPNEHIRTKSGSVMAVDIRG